MTECKSFNGERRIVSEAFVDWAYAYQEGKTSANVDIFRTKIAIAYMKMLLMSSYRKHTPPTRASHEHRVLLSSA